MSLVPCKECGEQISSSAKTCPKCGAKVPHFKWWLWVPVGLAVAFFTLGWVAGPHSPQQAYDQAYAKCMRELAGSGEPRGMTKDEICELAGDLARKNYR